MIIFGFEEILSFYLSWFENFSGEVLSLSQIQLNSQECLPLSFSLLFNQTTQLIARISTTDQGLGVNLISVQGLATKGLEKIVLAFSPSEVSMEKLFKTLYLVSGGATRGPRGGPGPLFKSSHCKENFNSI